MTVTCSPKTLGYSTCKQKMMKKYILMLMMVAMTISAKAQVAKVYDETIDPFEQIDKAVAKANESGKFVMIQLGGTGVLGA